VTESANGPDRLLVASPAQPVRPGKAAQLLTDELRRLIILQGKPGDFLPPERVLVETYEVSRPTLREAIRVLESEGLLEVRRGMHGGAVVRGASIEDLARRFGLYIQMQGATGGEVFRLRLLVEPTAAGLAAKRGKKAEPKLTAALVEEEQAIARAARDDTVSEVLVAFHDVVLELSGDKTLSAVGRLLDVIVKHHLQQALASAPADPTARLRALRKSHKAHQRIAEAIISGNAQLSEELARDHLDGVQRLAMAGYADLPIDILTTSAKNSAMDWSRFT
jgi:DNA-binding FadR family transcriptional regulator